ncbi:phosphopantetheine-binding protein [Desulfoluna sp.]|uniref:phosphopantetheine-binding protein n=1 Tax=Desulfoluna sp. TaxID=2045199 RepID=UPI0026043863|nr:phosphopantetheine-binding protein [Desulfoluna sp.]
MIMEESLKGNILETVAGFIRDVIGEDYMDDMDIVLETTFADDLEMESIEIVEFAEKIRDHYGERVDFAQWLSAMELDAIIHLSVAEVVDYIDSCLT